MKRAGLFLTICAVGAWGQIGAPTLGFVPEGFGVRTMQGIPAAGAVGPILETGRNLALITVSPRQNYVLATDAETGEVVLVTPSGGTLATATVVAGAAVNPDRIVMSPSGSSAVLWFDSTNRAQIVTGLPGAPLIREIDASVVGASPTAIAISDDGNWLALGTPEATVCYLFASTSANNVSMTAIPTGDLVTGLAFFYNRDALAMATPSQILTADPVSGGPPVQVGNLNPKSSAGDSPSVDLAVSTDNQRIIAAEGTLLTTINLATGVASTLDCGCQFAGLFGLGGSIFRITSLGFPLASFDGTETASGVESGAAADSIPRVALGGALNNTLTNQGVKLFDAENNRILAVPMALSTAGPLRTASSSSSPRRVISDAAPPALPAVTIGGLPASSGPAQQPAMTISIASAYPAAITGTATLTFASSVGGDDQTIQFGSGGRAVSFTIAAGSTQASFSGATSTNASSVAVLTGTVAGTITITLDFMASGTDITPAPAPTATITLITTPAFIQTVVFGSATTGAFTVVVTGFSTTRDMTTGLFQFAPSSNATLATSAVTVSLGEAFSIWYSNTASNATGSEFQLTVPFTTTNGPSADVIAVTVTLTNSKGASSAVVNSQ
jgi:hypothetical protein